MRVLITGINGFVGKILSGELKKRNHDVFGFDVTSAEEQVYSVDILDPENVSKELKRLQPEMVIHLAAIANVDFRDPAKIYRVNCSGTLNLLSACALLEVKPKFLFVSSSQVYGNVSEDRLPIDETFAVSPVNHYGASKAAAEMAVTAFGQENGIEYSVARSFNHTGPGQADSFVIPKIIQHAKTGKTGIELGNTETIRDITDVRDVVRAYILMAENHRNGSIYNICSNTGYKIRDIVEEISKLCGRHIDIIRNESYVRQNDIGAVIGSNLKIRTELGWKPEIVFRQTLADMLHVN